MTTTDGAEKPAAPVQDPCFTCGKRVYLSEKLEVTISGKPRLYHKEGCFRCAKCNCQLTATKFALHGGTVYCPTHQKEAFMLKGKYDSNDGEKPAAVGTDALSTEATSRATDENGCWHCGKKVYPAERMDIRVEKAVRVYHKTGCLRCAKCNCNLTVTTYTHYCGRTMCKTHQREAFTTKGSYGDSTPAAQKVETEAPAPTAEAPNLKERTEAYLQAATKAPAAEPAAEQPAEPAPAAETQVTEIVGEVQWDDNQNPAPECPAESEPAAEPEALLSAPASEEPAAEPEQAAEEGLLGAVPPPDFSAEQTDGAEVPPPAPEQAPTCE